MAEDEQQRIERCFKEHAPVIARYFLRRCASVSDAEEAAGAVG